ncbi:hypothetical protein ACX827_15185 [Burkholderia pseudomallei]
MHFRLFDQASDFCRPVVDRHRWNPFAQSIELGDDPICEPLCPLTASSNASGRGSRLTGCTMLGATKLPFLHLEKLLSGQLLRPGTSPRAFPKLQLSVSNPGLVFVALDPRSRRSRLIEKVATFSVNFLDRLDSGMVDTVDRYVQVLA